MVAGIPQIVAKTNLIKIPARVNVSYVVSAGSATWSEQNKTINYTASATGIYRLSVLSIAQFKIFTKYLWRHDTDTSSSVVSIVLNSGTEETFMLETTDKTFTFYYWCLEFVAETPQLVTL